MSRTFSMHGIVDICIQNSSLETCEEMTIWEDLIVDGG